VHTEHDQLLNNLTNDVQEYLKKKEIFFLNRREHDFTTENFHSWWIFFDWILMLYIPYPDGWVGFLVYVLKTYYDCKETDLKVLEEFERDYQPNKAIWW